MTRHCKLVLAVVLVAVLALAGCGYKEKLQNAEKTIGELNAENTTLKQKLSEVQTDAEKARQDAKMLEDRLAKLEKESKELSAGNKALTVEVAELKKTRDSLSKEVTELKKKNAELEQQNVQLQKSIEELKQQQPTPSPAASGKESVKPAPAPDKPVAPKEQGSSQAVPKEPGNNGPGNGKEAMKEQSGPSPCDAMIDYMRQSARAIRDLKGDERANALNTIESSLQGDLDRAPKAAVASAKKWVKELSTAWDKTGGDEIFKLLVLRNEALKKCGKTPEEAGF
jgi:outer membrane murein-binding lipoprotein Lpp